MAKNIKILIILLLSFLILILLLVLFAKRGGQPASTSPLPIPIFSPVPTSTPELGPAAQTPTFSKDPELKKRQMNAQPAIGNLVAILPYKGQYFDLDYSLHDFMFTLTLDSNKEQGMKEFEAFLTQHNIENSSMFTNLIIK